MIIDTHCHLSKNDYNNIDDVVNEMDGYMITSGCDDESNLEVLELISKYKNVYGTLGIHPESLDSISDKSFEIIENNINNPKIVGIGEIGLDYHYDIDKIKQKELFIKQLDLAVKYKKPVVVHSRDSIQDTFDILKKYKLKGTIHAFSSSKEMAHEFIKLGYKIGVGGVVTFKNGRVLQDVVKNVDIKDILLETDSPYLSPEPLRGKKNVPSNTCYVALKVAQLKNMSYEEVKNLTATNAIELFDLKIEV